jgi:hypothetical protein
LLYFFLSAFRCTQLWRGWWEVLEEIFSDTSNEEDETEYEDLCSLARSEFLSSTQKIKLQLDKLASFSLLYFRQTQRNPTL